MFDLAARPRGRPVSIDRSSDRLITLGAIGLALVFLAAALLATLLADGVRRGAWLPLHLALAGAASTAIAGVMPFFSAALAAAPPSGRRLRSTAILLVALGATLVSLGVVGLATGLAVGGGITFIAGIVTVGVATVAPLGRGLGASRGIVVRGYLAALANVSVGAGLAIAYLAGWPPLVAVWAGARGAHVWLNLVGFVALVIATTLLHLFPTVVGARIAAHPSARVAVAGLAIGAPTVALGLSIGSDVVARAGAIASVAGSWALAVYAWRTWRSKARWTTDRGWHLVAMGGLVSAIGWLQVGMTVAAGRVLVRGAAPDAWALDTVAGPLVVGSMSVAVVASATHLVPAIGPGTPVAHGRQRRLLGRAAATRLAMLNGGTAALALGLPLGLDPVVGAGVGLLAVALGLTAVLVGSAVRAGMARPPTA